MMPSFSSIINEIDYIINKIKIKIKSNNCEIIDINFTFLEHLLEVFCYIEKLLSEESNKFYKSDMELLKKLLYKGKLFINQSQIFLKYKNINLTFNDLIKQV